MSKMKENRLKTILSYALRWLLPLAFTVLLVCYMFRKVDFAEMWGIVTHGVDYWWILAAMGLSVVSHVLRALRWRIQLNDLGVLKLVFPRLGEVWRCTYISRLEHKSFTEVVGSMVADRLTDAVMVLSMTLLAFVVAAPAIRAFLVKYPVGEGIVATLGSPWTWVVLLGACALVWAVVRFYRTYPPVEKALGWIREMWRGFASLGRMRGKGRFALYSVAIWGCYYTQLYVAFFAFPFTRQLCAEPSLAFGLVPCLVAFVLSSIGMAVPSNGGLGPWNIAVMFGLAVYGIDDAKGTAFSMLQWSGQTVMLIILGVYTMAYISLTGRRRTHGDKQDLSSITKQ